ncbi:MAG: corrinoid protein [Candidatus Aminicenantes bacterium]|nr:corrinoid protein [Candidatus Aminicenantes bacterium]
MDRDTLLENMKTAVIEGNKQQAEELARKAVEQKEDLLDMIENGFVPGIQKVGDMWEKGDYFLPELIASAEAMKAAMNILQPEMEKIGVKARSTGRVVIGTVEGDIHDIGKSLVSSLLSANGFDVIDLGADVKLTLFIEKAEEVKADLICLSSLLTTTMLGQKRLLNMLSEKNIRDKYKILVGGAPVTRQWSENIGADGYAENAMSAVVEAKKLVDRKG